MQIIECQYFPCVEYISTLIKEQVIRIEKREYYQKMSFRNRCVVAGSNGAITLSIPLLFGREQRRQINDVELDNSSTWFNSHWKTLVSCYNRSPFFEYYGPAVHGILFSGETRLFDLNVKILKWLLQVLGVQIDLTFTEEFKVSYAESSNVDLRNWWLPKNFQSPDRLKTPGYNQVFSSKFGFVPNLSILDLLFCEGPNSLNILKGTNSPW